MSQSISQRAMRARSGHVDEDLPDQHVNVVEEARLDENGAEILNPVPVAGFVEFSAEPSMFDHLRQQQLGRAAYEAGLQEYETAEDADDFYIEDDQQPPGTPYEFEREPSYAEFQKLGQEVERQRLEAQKAGRPIPSLVEAFDAIYGGPEPAAPVEPPPPAKDSRQRQSSSKGGGGAAPAKPASATPGGGPADASSDTD